MTTSETRRLDEVAAKSVYDVGANAAGIRYGYKVLARHLVPGSILEMGPAEGLMTELLAGRGAPLTVLEGSSIFCDLLRSKFPQVSVVNSLFEDFAPESRFDNILLGHVLEHVEDPVAVLSKASAWLAPGGVVLGAVPNARSLHRQAAVMMGLLDREDGLNEMDRHHGHRRVFNPESFRQVFRQSGLHVDVFGGYWLKPLSNGQIERDWTPQMLDTFMALGERYPDIAAEIYVVATLPAARG